MTTSPPGRSDVVSREDGWRTPHRRTVLAGLGAAVAAPLLPASQATAAVFRRKVGAIDVMVISDGTLQAPQSFMLPETPPERVAALLISQGLPPQILSSQTNVTLVQAGNERVLIDAGSGPNFQPTAGKLAENLEAAGINPASITKVVFTHGHADHLWGAIDDFGDDERFPNASYVISPPEWDFWTDPDTPGRVPDWLQGMARGSARILTRLQSKTERRKAGEQIAPSLSYVPMHGHTPGHMAVMIEDRGERLLVGGDVLTHVAVSFAEPEWRWGGDHDRDQGAATRKRLLDRLVTDRIPLIGFHLSWPGYGIVERSGSAYRFVAR